MKNIVVRSLSGLFLIIIVIGAVWLNSISNYILFLLILILGLSEFYKMVRTLNYHPNIQLGIAVGFISYTLSYLVAAHVLPPIAFIILVPLFLFISIFELYRNKQHPINNLATTFLGLIYVALPLSLLHFMVLSPLPHPKSIAPDIINSLSSISVFNKQPNTVFYNSFILIGYFIIQWVSDTGAFVFGISFGKHRLFERISPKKSWEGAIGGFIATIGAAYIVHYLYPMLDLHHWIIISLIITFFGIFGDLIESLFKRSVNIKDSGSIMPGHGGILDRFDSTLLALPMVYFYLQIIYYF